MSLLGGLVTNLNALVVIRFALVPITYFLLWRTRFGLRLRSCREEAVAAESLGVNVYRYKYIGVVVSGAWPAWAARRWSPSTRGSSATWRARREDAATSASPP